MTLQNLQIKFESNDMVGAEVHLDAEKFADHAFSIFSTIFNFKYLHQSRTKGFYRKEAFVVGHFKLQTP